MNEQPENKFFADTVEWQKPNNNSETCCGQQQQPLHNTELTSDTRMKMPRRFCPTSK